MAERVLCVAAHPDDEALGCGGTLAKHVRAGDTVMVVTLADGVSSRTKLPATDVQRRRECLAALAVLGVTQNAFGDWPDNRFDSQPLLNIVRDIEQSINLFQPSIIYTHWSGDLNVDHRATHDAVNVACRPQPGCTVKQLYYFEVPCSTAWARGFVPNYYVDIADTLQVKLAACEAYESEMRPWPHPRSLLGISNLAAHRGSAVGIPAAEAFVFGRSIA